MVSPNTTTNFAITVRKVSTSFRDMGHVSHQCTRHMCSRDICLDIRFDDRTPRPKALQQQPVKLSLLQGTVSKRVAQYDLVQVSWQFPIQSLQDKCSYDRGRLIQGRVSDNHDSTVDIKG